MDCDRVDCQSKIFSSFFRAFLSNEHRVLERDDNTQARASSNVIGCIDIVDAIRQSTTFPSMNDDFNVNVKKQKKMKKKKTRCLRENQRFLRANCARL